MTESIQDWKTLGLSAEALNLVEQAGYNNPTPVQAAAIPIVLDGLDLLASAQTGTGKTAAFVLPMIDRFAGRQGTFGLVLAPTREIAQQTHAAIEQFGAPRGVKSIVLIGGINIRLDTKMLQTYPQIIVATPGRLCDHIERGNVWLDYVEVVVLDEADRMLDMGFADQLSKIMYEIPNEHQTLLFSATFPPAVERLAQRILYQPERVAIGSPMASASTVEHRFLLMREESKNRELERLLKEEKGSCIVFTRSKDTASRVWRWLHSRAIYEATCIHSDRLQAHREQALAEFKEGIYRVLIATDVAGRGIHVDAVAHVINYDLPRDVEDYIHRTGRTGRQGASGKASSFVTPADRRLIAAIEQAVGSKIPMEKRDAIELSSSRSGGYSQGRNQRRPSNRRGGSHGGNRGGSRGGSRDHGRQ